MEFLEQIMESMKEGLRSGILNNITGIFESVNARTAAIGEELSKTPKDWNSSIFNMVLNLSENVILPIAGVILTFILCYEIIAVITEKNNMHDIDTATFFQIFFKMGVAVFVLSNTFKIAMSFFDVAQFIILKAAGMINGGGLEVEASLEETLQNTTGLIELIEILVISFILKGFMMIVSFAIMVLLYGRFIQIYIYCSVAPIPFATFVNKEWGQMGYNYVRGLLALAFQGFFMLLCVAIYSALVQNLNTSEDVLGTLMEAATYTVILVLALFKTGQTSKSIFNAH